MLDIHWKPGSVKLAANPAFHRAGFNPAWMSWTAVGEAQARADAVDGYLDAVIPRAASGRAAIEGAVQAAVSSFGSGKRIMLDREVLLHFRDTPTKKRVMDSICADLLRAVGEAPVPGVRPTSFGGKCDLLALDSSGRLLAVEVKPRGVPTIGCRRLREPTWALPSVAGCGVTIVVRSRHQVGRPSPAHVADHRAAREPQLIGAALVGAGRP